MSKKLFLLFVFSCPLVLSNGLTDLLKNEASLVFDHTAGKFDENWFTLHKEWRKCGERDTRCKERVNQKIIKSIKQDFRTLAPLIVVAGTVTVVEELASPNIKAPINGAKGVLIDIPVAIIFSDMALKMFHLLAF